MFPDCSVAAELWCLENCIFGKVWHNSILLLKQCKGQLPIVVLFGVCLNNTTQSKQMDIDVSG